MPTAAELAHAVFRAAVRPQNCERSEDRADIVQGRRTGNVLQMASA
jgi:hypothetical protein